MSETRNIRLMRALEGAAIRTIESETLTDRLTAIVGQTYLLLGYQTPDSRTLAILVAKIASDLVESYGFMTVEEVSYCFDLGAKGLLGDFAGMNMRTVTRWLKGYKHSDIRYQAIMALRAERARATLPPPSAAYKEEHERNFLGLPIVAGARRNPPFAGREALRAQPVQELPPDEPPLYARGGPPGDHQQQGDGLAPEARVRRHDRTTLQ